MVFDLVTLMLSVVIGGLTGWAAQRVMRSVLAEDGLALDMIVGSSSAVSGGSLLNILAGRGLMPAPELESLLPAFVAAILVLGMSRYVCKPRGMVPC